jgi:hypothetical protein
MGANCPLVFGIAIPAFGYISSLRCEDTASIVAKVIIMSLLCQSEFISDSNRHCEERGNLLFFNRKGCKDLRKDLRKVRKVLTV